MGEDAEKKYLASLDFKIDEATKKLETISNQLDELAKKSEKTFENMKKNLDNSFSGSTSKNLNSSAINNMENLTKAQKTQLAIQETNAQKHAQKMEEIEARNQKQLTSKVKEGTSSRIAEYAKTYLTYQGFNQLKQAALDTVEAMKSVEYRMMEISRIMEEGSIVVNQYRDDLIDLAYEYGRSFDEVSSVTLNFARAGYDANDSLALTEDALLALNTAELDAAEATDGLISVMAQWGLDTGTTAEKSENLLSVIDKINKTADNFPISSEGLLQALQRTSQGFNLAGATIDETIALIVAAERASQRGGKVIGTAMSNIIQQLKAEGKLNLAEDLGLDFYEDEAQTTFKSITDIFAEMSERMTQLKNEGKESSTEMQSLLELFTVFRRNIGAGLLSEMEGEDSTYLQALETSMNSLGYSAEENSKYMSTATAATEQFNATLLKLQTSMWDSGGQDFFYAIINGASDLVETFNKLIDTIGVVPTSIGAVTLAFTAFGKGMNNFKFNTESGRIETSGFIKLIKEGTEEVRKYNNSFKTLSDGQIAFTDVVGKNEKAFSKNTAAVAKYTASLVTTRLTTIALQAATVALNAAISMGLSAAITVAISLISDLINEQKDYIESNNQIIQSSKEKIQELQNENETITNVIDRYKELSESEVRTPEVNKEIISLQEQIEESLGNQANSIDLINGKYDEQINKLNQILDENRNLQIENAKTANIAAQSNYDVGTSQFVQGGFFKSSEEQAVNTILQSTDDLNEAYNKLAERQEYLNSLISQMEAQGMKSYLARDIKSYNEELQITTSVMSELKEKIDAVTDSEDTLNNLLVEDYFSDNVQGNISSLQDFQEAIDKINQQPLMEGFKGDIEEQQELLRGLVESEYPELAQQLNELNADKFEENFEKNTNGIKDNINSILESLEGINSDEILELEAYGTDEQKQAYEELKGYAEEYEISVASLINKLIELKVIQGDLVDENYVNQIDNLKNAIYETSDSYDALSTAIDSYNQKGELTMEEVRNMLENTPELAKYIIKVGDSYKLNEQAMIDYNEVQERSIKATDEYIEKLKEQQFGTKDFVNTYNEFLDAINQEYDFESIKNLSEQVKEINQSFLDGETTATEYFDSLQEQISNIGEINIIDGEEASEEIEGMQAMFASFTQATVQGIEYIQAQFESGQINFAEYSKSIQEASDNILDLYTKSNELSLVDGQWVNAAGEVNDFANTLQSAKDELASFGNILGLLGENFDYISEHANAFGEAAFTAADEGTAAYQALATNMTNYLNQMKDTNAQAFNEIVNSMSASTGLMANEIVNSNGYINEGLLANSNNLNSAINSSTDQAGKAVGTVTNAMGNVIKALGDVIANFDYTLKGSLEAVEMGEIDVLGNKFKFPNTLRFNIHGEAGAGSNIADLAGALTDFGNQLSTYQSPSFNFSSLSRPGSYTSAARPTGVGSSGGSSGSSSSRDTSAEDAARAEAEAIKEYISMFEEIIDERERLEDRWVTNKKKLGLISNEDEKYILQESIKRYKQYVEEVNQLTYASEEEKTRLRKKYGEIAEDLEVEYFELLQDILDEEISAIEDKYDEDVDAYNDAVDAKIDKIKEQADAEIAALEEVEEENDRIRQREEYEANRNELVHGYQGVEYWEQRTGREAQLALAEAKKKVEDLDKNWEETVNKWNVEDQIKLIEERRDADIEATEAERDAYLKALEETKNAEIQALKDKYQYQLDYFNQTGQIIQDNATIQSEELFKIYKKKFIDPVGEELRKALNSYNEYKASASTSTSSGGSTTTYTIQYGDTLSGIAARYGTTIEKIMAANPSITDRNIIYAGRQLRIPTSHTGSKVISDGIVELQAGETVLNMDWARGLDRMLGQFARNENNTNNITNGSTINVDGDLIKVEANIEDKTDAAYFSKRLFREMESKFNIKK